MFGGAPKDARGRPSADSAYTQLIRALRDIAPEKLGHLDAARILVIAGAARRESSASVRPLTFGGDPPRFEAGGFKKPRITIGGVTCLYEICLRPKFFSAALGGARARLSVFVHELWHISPAFDGALAEERRHETSRGARELEREVHEIAERFASSRAWPEAEELLGHRGELRMCSWLARPPSREPLGSRARAEYDERDLYFSVIEQDCPKSF